MRKLGAVVATLLAASFSVAVAGPPPHMNTFTVDCAKGQTISGALARGDERKPLVINVRGTCNEFVKIDRPNVTLHGDPVASINAPNSDADLMTIDADGVTLENLVLTGGYYGIRQDHAFRFMVTNCVIQDTRSDGIRGFVGDTRFIGSTVQRAGGNGVYLTRGGSLAASGSSQFLNNAGTGIHAYGNSTVAVSGSTISGNGSHGVQLESGSQGNLASSVIAGNGTNSNKGGAGISVTQSRAGISGGNTISNNREDGVLAVADATVGVDDNTITENGSNGVFGYLGSTLVLHGNEIARNGTGVACRADCTLQVGGAYIHDNATHAVVVMLDSRAIFEAPVTTATPNGWVDLWCGDKKSSVDGVDGLSYDGGDFFDGSVSPTCVGFSD